jgi:uncharacterized protein (TIGR03546 family)
MYLTYKLTRGTFKSLLSTAEPWQIMVGTALGTLLGFLPLWPLTQGPSPLWLGLFALALVINCHLGSVLLFFGIGKLLAKILAGPAIVVGQSLEGFARTAADVPFLYWSLLSHSGYLGLTCLGGAFAILFAVLMSWAVRWFRALIKAKLEANATLLKAGKFADRPILFRIACWFLGL